VGNLVWHNCAPTLVGCIAALVLLCGLIAAVLHTFEPRTIEGPVGPTGYQGPKGDRGEPGHLQLSGFPDGTKIYLTDDTGLVLWRGEVER
jgi:hypothetical protein